MDFQLDFEQRSIQEATQKMVSRDIQPVLDAHDADQPLPKGFEQMITVAKPLAFSTDEVAANRKNWIREWLQAVTQ